MSLAAVLAPYVFSGYDPSNKGRPAVWRDPGRDVPNDPGQTSNADAEDTALALLVRDGDAAAMRELVLAFADRLVRFAHTMTHDRSTAESLAYDVLADVWERRDRLRADRSLKAYLFSSVRHRALDMLAHARVRERHAARLRDDADAHASAWSVPGPDTELDVASDAAELAARMILLREAVAALSERRRLALHLRFDEGLSYPAVGEVLGLSDKAAQQLVLRTLAALRRALGV